MTHRRLTRLHGLNGWNLLFLLITGLILYLPGLRGALAPLRTPLKSLHIGSGVLSLALLAAYLPLSRGHWDRLRSRIGQKANVVLLVGLLLGWGATGVLLWFNRYMPEGVAEAALVWHDLLTWFAIPWAVAHSLTRYFKLRILPVTGPVLENRRVLLGAAAALGGGLLWRNLGRALGLPGLEGSQEAASAGDLRKNQHTPIAPGCPFEPAPVSDPPEGGGARGRFRVYSVVDPMPVFDSCNWEFKLYGLVDRPRTFTWEEFQALPRTVQVSHFHCVTGWSVYDVTWEGVKLSHLLELAGVQPAGKQLKLISGDGAYTSGIPLAVGQMEDVLLPYIMDGRPLATPLGGPVRLIIPGMYAYKSVKWLQAVEVVAEEHVGYWEALGYPSDAWLKKG